MVKKRMTMSLVALVSSVLLFIIATFAWLTVSNIVHVGDQTIILGSLRYTLVEDPFIAPTTIILPGDGADYGTELLATDITITNTSTTTSQVRFLVEYTKWAGTTETTEVYQGGTTEPFKAVFATGFVCVDDFWYLYDEGSEEIFDANSGMLTAITSMYYDGEYAGIDYSTNNVTVTVSVEAKQSTDATWSLVTIYVFTTMR
jgi:hypothetical protein